jgi:hypothetical protein
MHHRPYQKKNCPEPRPGEAHAQRAIGGNPRIYVGERKVQLIMFTYVNLI